MASSVLEGWLPLAGDVKARTGENKAQPQRTGSGAPGSNTGKRLTEIPALEKQAKALTKERDRLVEAINQTTELISALVAALSGTETQLQELGNLIRLRWSSPRSRRQNGKRYRIEGQVDAGVLLMASPAGFEPA